MAARAVSTFPRSGPGHGCPSPSTSRGSCLHQSVDQLFSLVAKIAFHLKQRVGLDHLPAGLYIAAEPFFKQLRSPVGDHSHHSGDRQSLTGRIPG